MCGIAGIALGEGALIDPDVLERLSISLTHRGPDDRGTYVSPMRTGVPSVGFVHTRLSIIDLVAGHQPMSNEDGTVWVTFNGEIYNYTQLRSYLEGRGHQFRSRSDTEVLVHLYEEHGQDFIQKLRGMFAFALFDERTNTLLLARDRFGIKPLVYACDSKRLAFASEIEPLLHSGLVDDAVDLEALDVYFSFYYIPSPHTVYRHIRRLPPGHAMIWRQGTSPQFVQYWDMPERNREVPGEGSIRETICELLGDAVQTHLQSDVPVGIFLSGGVDSASLTALASQGTRPSTFSVGFEESAFSELSMAREVSRLFGTSHHEIVITASDVPEALAEVLRRAGEPVGDWSSVLQFHLAGLARQTVKVVLSGAGADEMFAGYPTIGAYRAGLCYRSLLPRQVRSKVVRRLAGLVPVGGGRLPLGYMLRQFVEGVEASPLAAHLSYKQIFTPAQKASLYTSAMRDSVAGCDPFGPYLETARAHGGGDMLGKLLYLDVKTFLEGAVLRNADVSSMAHSVEVRTPFLDNRLSDYVCGIPGNLLYKGIRGTKSLFRKSVSEFLPDSISTRPKRGFVPPASLWLRGGLKEFARSVLSERAVRNIGLLEPGHVGSLLEAHLRGQADHTRQLTCLISFVLWWQQTGGSS